MLGGGAAVRTRLAVLVGLGVDGITVHEGGFLILVIAVAVAVVVALEDRVEGHTEGPGVRKNGEPSMAEG